MADNSVKEISGHAPSDVFAVTSNNSLENAVSNPNSLDFIENERTSEAKSKDSVDLKMDESANVDIKDEPFGDTNKEVEDEWLDILGSGHLKKKVLVKGKPDSRPHRGETVIISVVGKLENSKEFERIDKLEITIGDAEVVQGIEYALPLMDSGETAEIIVGPRFGYGSIGNLPCIPKDATLYYTVSVVDILGIKEIPSLSIDDRLSSGSQKKDRGNWWYQRKEYHLAIQCYRKALQYFEEDITVTDDRLDEVKLKTYNNLSAAHYYLEAYDAALTSVNNVLVQEPHNIKGIYRKVKILKAQGEIEQAIALAKNGMKAKPDSPALQDELNLLIELKKKSTSAQKVLYQKMFKNTDDKSKTESKSKRSLFRRLKWFGVITIAVGILGIAAVKFK